MTDSDQNPRAIQDLGVLGQCWACGADNDLGLQIKSYWTGQDAVCRFRPRPEHMAAPNILNGGIIASIIDCHSLATATAAAYQAEGREIGSDPRIAYVTGTIQLKYLRPTPMDNPIELRAWVKEMGERKAIVLCSLVANGEECATGEVIGVRTNAARIQG